MSQKIFLTSALAIGVFAPAFAEPTNTGTFPSDGYMEEDYTYTNAATSDNMDGVYSGTVNAVAEYDVIDYILSAGKYLPADSETITTCPAGSFCAGGTTVQYNQSSAQGIETCPSGFASSADGSSSNTQCYRACDINNMGANGSISSIAHATAISGNDYYGNGTDTCEPTACENGWHVKAGVNGSAIASTIGTGMGASYVDINNNGHFSEDSADHGQSYYGINGANTWAVDYGSSKGMLIGQARCSTQSGHGPWNWSTDSVQNPTITSNLTDETGQQGAINCYCNVTGYKDTNGNLQSLSSPWVFVEFGDACADECANICAAKMRYNDAQQLAVRAAVLGSVSPSLAMCEANTITINWSDASAADISANNAGTATYGSDVRTPVKAATKKGKTFRGWRFSAPEQTNLP